MRKYIGKLRQLARSYMSPKRHPIMQGRVQPADEFESTVNRLTQWQRVQWARAGYPGLVKPERRSAELVAPFTLKMRPAKNVALGRAMAK